MPMTIHTSKLKPEIEFQNGGRPFSETGMGCSVKEWSYLRETFYTQVISYGYLTTFFHITVYALSLICSDAIIFLCLVPTHSFYSSRCLLPLRCMQRRRSHPGGARAPPLLRVGGRRGTGLNGICVTQCPFRDVFFSVTEFFIHGNLHYFIIGDSN